MKIFLRPGERSDTAWEDLAKSYDEIFRSPGYMRDSDAFYSWILHLLKASPGKRLLDIGCGEGHLLRLGRKLGLIPFGVDLSLVGAQTAKEIAGANVIALAAGEQLPFSKNSFDLVTNIGSLEHFLDPSMGLREMRRVMATDALAALVLPNSYYLVDIVWQVWRTGYSPSHKQQLERFATFREWWDLIEENGFSIRRAQKYNLKFPRTKADLNWYRRHPRKILNLIFSPIIPTNLSYHFVYICSKR